MTDESNPPERRDGMEGATDPRFARAFLPGLIVGLVLGLFIGAFAAPLIGGGSSVTRDTGRRAAVDGAKPVHEPEVVPGGQAAPEAPANDAENKKTDLPDQPAPPSQPPGAN